MCIHYARRILHHVIACLYSSEQYVVTGTPRLGRTSSVVAPGLARRSADIPLQQLLEAQRVPTAPRARRASVGGLVPIAPGTEGEMVPYNPRARRMSTVITAQRVLPTEASALPLSALTIPEEGAITKPGTFTGVTELLNA